MAEHDQKVSVHWCQDAKREGRKITMLTAYDYLMARALDEAGVDILLVGDSLGMVMQGKDDTLAVTVDDVVYHTRCVAAGVSRALIIGDMPFMSFQLSPEEAARNAGRMVKEGGANAVKLEGGREMVPAIEAILHAGIPVMGHLGLVPQSVNKFGGYKVQARSETAVAQLVDDARALEEAGVFAIVLEGIPRAAARRVSEEITIPSIGIGAGPDCDGQVLVAHDMLGLSDNGFKFVKKYANLREIIVSAVQQYIDEVLKGEFPTKEFSYNMKIRNDVLVD